MDTKENLVLHVVGDSSYRNDGPSIGGKLIMLGSQRSDRVNPILWKSKQIVNVCHSAKDAETRNIMNIVEDGLYMAQQLSMLLFGSKELRIPVKVYTDSKPLLDSISSTRQVTSKLLRNTMTDLKRKLEYGEIISYSWIETSAMTADILTKESGDVENILEVVRENRFRRANSTKNIVLFRDGEIMMQNGFPMVASNASCDVEFVQDALAQIEAGGNDRVWSSKDVLNSSSSPIWNKLYNQ